MRYLQNNPQAIAERHLPFTEKRLCFMHHRTAYKTGRK